MRIYDSLSSSKQKLDLNDVVRILVCGPTVYDFTHIGHARLLVFYDLFARYLASKGILPFVILNITDIDIKIYRKAAEEGIQLNELADRFIDALICDMSLLGISDAFCLARVSDHMIFAQSAVRNLLARQKAYSAGGNIYLDTSQIPFHGSLAKMKRHDFENCRLDIAPGKRRTPDILIWNAAENFDGMTFPDNVLGEGIPWWHLQDSSVAMAIFDGKYDLQGGAVELVYPHHESHLAQLCSLTLESNPVKYWLHIGLVYVNGMKMSKSLQNTVRVRDLLQKYGSNVIKLYLLSFHYRKQLDFSEKDLARFSKIDNDFASVLSDGKRNKTPKDDNSQGRHSFAGFVACLENDFDTSGALKIMISSARRGMKPDLARMVKIFGLRY